METNEKSRVLDMTRGNPFRLVLKFALPLFFGNLLQQFYNLADTAIAGHVLGDHALAQIGAVSALYGLITNFAFGMNNGLALSLSRSFGAGDEQKMKHVSCWMVTISMSVSIVLMSIFLLCKEPLLILLQDGFLKRYPNFRPTVALYPWKCENAVFQFNEVYNGPSTNADGSPYDMDSGLKDVVYQFNYSHNNPCGWMLYMGKNNNDIIRYNISDDGGDYIIKYFLTACETPTYFLNNVIIYDGERTKFMHRDPFKSQTYFYNNVFYNKSTTTTTTWHDTANASTATVTTLENNRGLFPRRAMDSLIGSVISFRFTSIIFDSGTPLINAISTALFHSRRFWLSASISCAFGLFFPIFFVAR